MKKTSELNFINSVKVIVSPWQKGFTCGIIMDSKSKMSTEQYELCSTIARGMIKMATTDVAEFDDESNVVDFLEYLKMKRDKELN
jgi:hypothetical protein